MSILEAREKIRLILRTVMALSLISIMLTLQLICIGHKHNAEIPDDSVCSHHYHGDHHHDGDGHTPQEDSSCALCDYIAHNPCPVILDPFEFVFSITDFRISDDIAKGQVHPVLFKSKKVINKGPPSSFVIA